MALSNTVSDSIFRAYDIRGIVGETLDETTITEIGRAIASIALEENQSSLIVARDGRVSSPSLCSALIKGIIAAGCNVIDIGMVASPILYYATHCFTATTSGVIVTGSHNPGNYNGLKIIIKGLPLSQEKIKSIYHRIVAKAVYTGVGNYSQKEITDDYIDFICRNVTLAKPLKIICDAGNGVTGPIVTRLYSQLGCEVIPLFCEVDGNFPNHHPDPCDAANMQHLIDAVKEHNADVGLAFDGDGDRLGMVTNTGEIILADRLLMLFAQSILKQQSQAKVIFDVKCSNNLSRVVKQYGGIPIMWKTGHSLIRSKLLETSAILAGEMSGHFFFRDRWFGFDDALYSGARLLEIITQQASDCAAMFEDIPNSINTPELKVFVNDDEKFNLMQRLIAQANFDGAKHIETIDGLRVDFDDGWGLLRPSNTSPYLILRFEASSEEQLQNIQMRFRKLILDVNADLALPF